MPGALRGAGARSPAVVGANDGLELRWVAVVGAGGIVEVRRPAALLGGWRLGLNFVVAVVVVVVGFLAAGGVLVLDVDALETPLLPSCFVGDFVGERNPLNPALAPGVGLPAIALPRLPGPSAKLCLFSPFRPAGIPLALLFPGTPLPAALALDFASSSTWRTPAGRKNMPYPCSH